MERQHLQKTLLTAALLLLAACMSGAVMTRQDFDSIEPGTPVTEITQQYGNPLRISKQKDGTQIYEYIERLPIGQETVEERKYQLVIKNGEVVSKRYNQELPPPYDEIYDEDPNDIPN